MFRYSTIYINLASFFISIIIFISGNFIFSNYQNFTQKSVLKAGFKVENIQLNLNQSNITNEQIKNETTVETTVKTEEEIKQENAKEEKKEQSDWYLEIPSINLKADIKEGTTKEIMDNFIGHFEETSKNLGNVGLAAHNRGYKNNYFENLKKLREGDSIYYQYRENIREYIVVTHEIIRDTDWSYLEETEENTITLITCVENEPEYRRCIQAVENI